VTVTASIDGVSAAVRERLEGEQLHVIGGERVASADGATFETLDPATGDLLATVAYAGQAEVAAAVAAAREAFEDGSEWRTMVPAKRGAAIAKLAALIKANGDELAELESLDNGKPLKFAKAVDVRSTVAHFEYFAGWPTKIEGAVLPVSTPGVFGYTLREPVGVVVQIIPWNFPLLMSAWKAAPALAAGCTIVLKPAEQTPLSALRVGELALEAGIPAGVLNVLAGDGDTGRRLVEHPDVDKVSFTGSTAVGREIGASAGRDLKRVTLELGGKSPNVILPDADIAAAVKGSFTGMYFNSGQVCAAATRLFAPADRFEEVVEAIAQQAEKTVPGPGLDPKTFVGPVVSAEQHDRVKGYIESGRGEAELRAGGGSDLGDGGYFIEPTLFTTDDDDARIVREEIFGPVLVAQSYESLEEVATRANASEYGLAAGVWTKDLSSAHRLAKLLRAGSVYINTWNPADPAAPFGGFKSSGVGREHGRDGLDTYLETKTVLAQL
jgi:acyl-CoA reductase-like NAD-dependent aldehyde dehydrogenase